MYDKPSHEDGNVVIVCMSNTYQVATIKFLDPRQMTHNLSMVAGYHSPVTFLFRGVLTASIRWEEALP